MRVKALITGVENVKGNGKGDNPKPYDFWKVAFIDTENKTGTPQSMTLTSKPDELAKILPQFKDAHMKIIEFNVFANGNYMNFGGMLP